MSPDEARRIIREKAKRLQVESAREIVRSAQANTRTLQERTAETFGLDPTLDRGAILPLARNPEGGMEWAVPQAGVEVLEAMQTLPHAMGGGIVTPRDVTSAAMAVGPGRASVGRTSLGRYLSETPEAETIKQGASRLYQMAKNSGTVVRPEAAENFVARLAKRLDREGFRSSDLTPDTVSTLREWQRAIESGRPIDFQELQNWRTQALSAAGAPKPADAAGGAILLDEIDQFFDGLNNQSMTSTLQPDKLKRIVGTARGMWKRQAKMGEINRRLARAELAASGLENGLRTEFRALAKDPKRLRYFSLEERKRIQAIAQGDAVQNTLRFLSKMGLPIQGSNRGLGAAVGPAAAGLAAGATAGPAAIGPVAAGALATGTAAGGLAALRAARQPEILRAMIARGQEVPGYTKLPADALRRALYPMAAAEMPGEPGQVQLGPTRAPAQISPLERALNAIAPTRQRTTQTRSPLFEAMMLGPRKVY